MNTIEYLLNLQNNFNYVYSNSLPISSKREDDKNFYIDLEVPGYKKEDIDVQYQDGVITIDSKKNKYNPIGFYSSEGGFTKHFNLEDIEYKKISAKLENGILTVTLPKSQAVIEKRKVTKIKIAGS